MDTQIGKHGGLEEQQGDLLYRSWEIGAVITIANIYLLLCARQYSKNIRELISFNPDHNHMIDMI